MDEAWLQPFVPSIAMHMIGGSRGSSELKFGSSFPPVAIRTVLKGTRKISPL